MADKTTADVQLVHQETQWEKHSFPLTIACDNWKDPRNVGMAFRLAEAFGVQSVWLGGNTPVPPNQKIKRASRSTYNRVAYAYKANLKEALLKAQSEGQRIIGIEITSNSDKIRDVATRYHSQKSILVLGAEKSGIDQDILAIVDACAHIPMYGDNSSLNVATALAVSLYAWTEAMSTL